MKRLLISAAAIALMSSAALAADIPVFEPAPIEAPLPVGFDWSGFYTGFFGGYGWSDVDVHDLDDYNGIDGDFSYETDGFYFGTLVGYNLHYNWALLGIEGELGRLEFEDEEQFPDFRDDIDRDGDSIASVDIDTFGNISGRLGLTWNNWLLYGKGGFAFADVEVEFEDANENGVTLINGTEEEDWLFGYTVGGGIEVGFWESWSIRGEYMYTDLEDISHTVTADTNGNGIGDQDFEFEHELNDIHTVKLGITNRF